MYLKTMLYRGIELEKTGGVTIDLAKLGGYSGPRGGSNWALVHARRCAELTKLVEEAFKSAALEDLPSDAVDAIRRERTKTLHRAGPLA